MELATTGVNSKRVACALAGICVLALIVSQVMKRSSGSPQAAVEIPDDPPEVAEQKARATVTQFFDAGMKRDPATVLKLVDVPWVWDGDNFSDNDSRATGVIRDKSDLERRLTRSVLKPKPSKDGTLQTKITGARRWAVLSLAIPWAEDAEAAENKRELSAIAEANGWLVQVEISYQGAVLVKPQILVVVAKGVAKVRGGWFRGQEDLERLIVP